MTTSTELDIFALFAPDNKDAVEAGTWMDLSATTSIKVRSANSKIVSDKREELLKPFAVLLRTGAKIPDAQNEEIGLRIISESVIADWKGIQNVDKVVVKYTAEEAYNILKALPKLASAIMNWAQESSNYSETLVEDSAKNS